jgi:hypothetical protein
MKYTLTLYYRWMVVSEDGLLKVPRDQWGDEQHMLSRLFTSRGEAIEEYCRFINQGLHCPNAMILVEEHAKGINWDE